MSYAQSNQAVPGVRSRRAASFASPSGARLTRIAGVIALAFAAATVCNVRPALCQPGAAYPGVDLQKLDDAGRTLFGQIVEEQFCPCGKPQSFKDTLKDPKACAVAPRLGQHLADDLASGMARRDAVRALLKRIANINARFHFDTASSPRMGPADAKIEIVVFSDFECPYCREVSAPLQKLVRTRKDVALVYKFFPLSFHENSPAAARYAWAAYKQGHFWELHDLLFDHQKELDDDLMRKLGKEASLDLKRLDADRQSDAATARIEADRAEGDRAGVEGTPTLFVNGLYLEKIEGLNEAIAGALELQ